MSPWTLPDRRQAILGPNTLLTRIAIEPEAGSLVVFAAKHGETALDGDGTNSPFATAFVKEITTPGIEIRKVFDLVRDDVLEMTNRKQQPFTYGSVPGRQDFFFVQR